MLIHRLYLRNYRVFEDELELQLPGGLIGVYGPNGAGKSALIESIRWTLWGKSRTTKEQIRTAGVNGDCLTEVEFEHEGHLYLARRTISGVGHTVKAEVHADGKLVNEGVRDVARYLESVLGMDDTAFRASVFAEQKQVASFTADTSPDARRKLVLSLLGITPLESARDLARKDARDAKALFDRARANLPDLDELEANRDRLQAAAEGKEAESAAEAAVAATAKADADAAQRDLEVLDDARAEHERILTEGKAARAEVERATREIEALTVEIAELDRQAPRLDALEAATRGVEEAEERLQVVRDAERAAAAVAAIAVPEEPPSPAEAVAAAAAARAAAEQAVAADGEVAGSLKAAQAHLERARTALTRSAEASSDDVCPTCGQALGDAFAQVRAHRQAELDDAEAELARLQAAREASRHDATVAQRAATAAVETAAAAEAAHREWAAARQRRDEAQATLDAILAGLDRAPEPEEAARLAEQVRIGRQAAKDLGELRGRLERRPAAQAALDAAVVARDEAEAARLRLKEKLAGIGFDGERYAQAKQRRDDLRIAAERATALAQQALLAAEAAKREAAIAADRLAAGRAQHDQIADLQSETIHLQRTAELLHGFRGTVINAIGPRLSAQAAELFAELTDHEYEHLEVDPDSYDIRIHDKGTAYGMNRFSGSETDLANLALRVAISEHVKFQSGGAVGLLVLDEVFGPLDDDRKERMLHALERLKARFRQVLVVTHDSDIKEQLQSAIEVSKLPGRRATARLVAVGS